ncbi:MAG: APC family permease [Acidobacteria bacterium]|nr:APC family permease [Acidobacteriota bacterium]
MLSFISFWRAAAIVLCDLGSSAFYVGGIAEHAIGKAAPWFILGIMLFGYAVRSIYVESSAMFVRGGVYRVVHEAMGGTLAKFSVSALMFDYVLTGPISGVSAGLYLAGLINETAVLVHHPGVHVHPPYFAAGFAVVATLYFWRKNLAGMHESSEKALRIMQLTTVMVVLIILWSLVTMAAKGFAPVPLPTPENIRFDDSALGWLKGTALPSLWGIAVLVGLGHSLLAMSGFETLAQVNREIASPKLQNLKRAGLVIFVYSLSFTALVTFFAAMLIPDHERKTVYIDNLIGGLAMYMAGPGWARLLLHAFVVLVGTVILSGAVNTAIIGSNGVLNRVAEDGILPDWFRHPHRKFGTTHRMINLVVLLQIVTIVLSRGDVFLLGEAYAFGVVWSFAMKSLSVLVLRYKIHQEREYKVPLNFRFRGVEIPVGLGLITLFLFALAVANLLTKKVATISGLSFTLAFFAVFILTERYNARRRQGRAHEQEPEKFLLDAAAEFSAEKINVRPGNVLVAVRNPHLLDHVVNTLEKIDTRRIDIVVMTVKRVTEAGSGESDLKPEQVFTDDIAGLFSKVVTVAEKAGKHVELMVVPGMEAIAAVVETAYRLKSGTIVMGRSPRLVPAQQAMQFGAAWEKLPAPRPQMSLQILDRETGRSEYYNLGPHPPRLWPEDVEFLHRLWLDLSERGFGHKLHHRDLVRVALRRLDADLHSDRSPAVLEDLSREVAGGGPETAP